MLKAIVEHNGNTLFLEFPCKRHVMAEHLASIGITKKAHEISCGDNGDEQIKVRIYGESEFEKKLASFVSSDDTLSLINTTCEIYQNMPYQNKLDAMDAVLNDKVSSIADFDKFMLESRMQDTTNHYYCPLVANLYTKDEYGDMEEYPEEYDGSYLPPYEERIREIIKQEDSLDESNLAEYFDGSNSVIAKLKEIHFGTQNVDETLYGCIRVELTQPFTDEEETEFKEWLEGQCSDGYGEGLEQRPIKVEDGNLFVSFWHGGDDYFLLNDEEFDDYLNGQAMRGIE